VSTTPARTEARAPLTRDRVLQAAMELADSGGIEALTMRRLARALGVEAMSIYYHAANKDAILDGIVDLVLQQIELPAAGAGWKAALKASAMSAHGVLRRHPWACDLLMSAPSVSAARLRQIDALLGSLRDAGLPAETTDLAYHALDSHILGFTLWEAGYSSGLRGLPPDFATTFLRDLPAERYPNLAEHMAYHARPATGKPPSEFEFGLDLILDGLERLRGAG
jgi:AcrR family transcriptional regulator